MLRILTIILSVFVAVHGLIHLMGFVAYWPLREVSELPYKTSLLSGKLEVGAAGMRALQPAVDAGGDRFRHRCSRYALRQVLVGTADAVRYPVLPVVVHPGLGAAYRGAIINIAILLLLFVVFGFRLQPAPFPAYSAASAPVTTTAIPAGLPAPVERYLRLTYGDAVPVYTSAVMSGRGSLRFMGLTMPARLRFTHELGKNYRHYIETTFYGIPVFKVNERYLDGHTLMELPFGVEEDTPGTDGAANQGLWAETIFYPAYLVTDPRLRWEAVDEDTARLFVPFKDGEQEFTVEFEPQSGMMTHIETLRYRDEKSGFLRWWGDHIYGIDQNGDPVLEGFSVTWEDEGTPWLKIKVEDMVFNTDVSQYIRQKGP